MNYLGKPISEHDLWALGEVLTSLKAAEKKREAASKHPKFEKMEFPPPNPAFLELKSAIELEIKNRTTHNTKFNRNLKNA